MFSSWLSRRSVRQAAMAGLALGLAALAALTVGGAISTQQATANVRAFSQVTNHWGLVFVQISEEDAALRKYLDTGTDHDHTALALTTGAAEPPMAWLAEHGGSEEAFQVSLLRNDYRRYTNTLQAILDAGHQHDQIAIDANVQPASLGFAALRRQVVANVERNQRDLNAYLADVDRRNQTLKSFAVGVFGADLATFALCSAILIGYQRRIERQAVASRHQAMHDSLTGLANRALFRDRADQAVRLAARTGQPLGLVAIDLNGFKQVNDTLGHHSGDLLLQHVAERLIECVRDTDTVARLGGDEFSILLPNVTSVAHATDVADRVLHAIKQPLNLDGVPAEVGGSIGVVVFPDHGEHIEQLLQRADAAMYTAKRHHLGICVYDAIEQYEPAPVEAASVKAAPNRRLVSPEPVRS